MLCHETEHPGSAGLIFSANFSGTIDKALFMVLLYETRCFEIRYRLLFVKRFSEFIFVIAQIEWFSYGQFAD